MHKDLEQLIYSKTRNIIPSRRDDRPLLLKRLSTRSNSSELDIFMSGTLPSEYFKWALSSYVEFIRQRFGGFGKVDGMISLFRLEDYRLKHKDEDSPLMYLALKQMSIEDPFESIKTLFKLFRTTKLGYRVRRAQSGFRGVTFVVFDDQAVHEIAYTEIQTTERIVAIQMASLKLTESISPKFYGALVFLFQVHRTSTELADRVLKRNDSLDISIPSLEIESSFKLAMDDNEGSRKQQNDFYFAELKIEAVKKPNNDEPLSNSVSMFLANKFRKFNEFVSKGNAKSLIDSTFYHNQSQQQATTAHRQRVSVTMDIKPNWAITEQKYTASSSQEIKLDSLEIISMGNRSSPVLSPDSLGFVSEEVLSLADEFLFRKYNKHIKDSVWFVEYSQTMEDHKTPLYIDKTYFTEDTRNNFRGVWKTTLIQHTAKSCVNGITPVMERDTSGGFITLKDASKNTMLTRLHVSRGGLLTQSKEHVEEFLYLSSIGHKNLKFLKLLLEFFFSNDMNDLWSLYDKEYEEVFSPIVIDQVDHYEPLVKYLSAQSVKIEAVKINCSKNILSSEISNNGDNGKSLDFASILIRYIQIIFREPLSKDGTVNGDKFVLSRSLSSKFDRSFLSFELTLTSVKKKDLGFNLGCLVIAYALFEDFRTRHTDRIVQATEEIALQFAPTRVEIFDKKTMDQLVREYKEEKKRPGTIIISNIVAKRFKTPFVIQTENCEDGKFNVTGNLGSVVLVKMKVVAKGMKEARATFNEILDKWFNEMSAIENV
jgi:hypothetical protein